MSNVIALKCVGCQREFSPKKIDYTCPDCGSLYGTLDVIYDYDKVAKELNKDSLANNRDYSHFRYLPILPIEERKFIPPLIVGWTPMYRAKRLEEQWNLGEVWIKDDGRNPSASLKDRASSIAVVKAQEKGVSTVTAASTGNAASSWSVFTALADLPTVIFVPHNAPKAKLAQLLLYGATVLQVNGNYDRAFDLCCQAADKWGWYNRSTAINPYLGEGKKTAALEICEQLNWQVPDYVLVSVGDGCIIQGMCKGFQEFYRLKLIDRLPKVIGVQANGSAPLVKAWNEKKDRAEAMEPSTVADSISVGVPRDQVKALKAVRELDGMFISVSDQEILAAISTLATTVGVLAEPAGATALAGLKQLVKQGICQAKQRAVAMVTGHGLKDIDGVLKAVTQKPLEVENSLTDVEKKLQMVSSMC